MGKKNYSEEIARKIEEWLVEKGLKYLFDDEKGTFRFNAPSLGGKIRNLDHLIRVEDDLFYVHAYLPIKADHKNSKRMGEVAKFLCHTTFTMKFTHFAMDLDDGEIYVASLVSCEDRVPTEEEISRSIATLGITFARYGDALLDVIFGVTTAAEACGKLSNPASGFSSLRELLESVQNSSQDEDKEEDDDDDDDDDDDLFFGLDDDDDDDDDDDEEDENEEPDAEDDEDGEADAEDGDDGEDEEKDDDDDDDED